MVGVTIPKGVSKNGVPQNGWSMRENSIRMDDEQGTPILGNLQFLFKPMYQPQSTIAFLPICTTRWHVPAAAPKT